MANAMRFYVSWMILIAVHLWIFLIIPRNSIKCKTKTENINASSQTTSEDLDPLACSFKNSGYTVMFYILFCIYFALVAL